MLKNIMQYIDGYFSLTAGHRGGPRWRHQRSGGDHTQEICEYTRNQSPPHPKKNNFNTITLFCISCYYEALSNFFLTLSREVLHMSLILYKVTGFFLLVLINFRQYNSVAGVLILGNIGFSTCTCKPTKSDCKRFILYFKFGNW